MIFTVTNYHTKEEKSFSITINANIDTFIVMEQFQAMWKALCKDRDLIPARYQNGYFTGITTKDADAFQGPGTAINAETLFNAMIRMLNAYLPSENGVKVIRYIFGVGTICLSQVFVNAMGATNDKVVNPLLPDRLGIFNFNYYSNFDWAKYSVKAIADASMSIGYPICDFSEICRLIFASDINTRPMAWVNPMILQSFLDIDDSHISISNLQLVAASFVICHALDHKGKAKDRQIKDLWNVLRDFAEGKLNDNNFIAIYHMSETYIEAHHHHLEDGITE